MSEFLYGINPAFEAIRAGRRQVIRLYLSQGSEQNPRLRKLAQVAEKYQVPVEAVDKSSLFDLCQTREHQGCVLETGPFPYTPFAEMLGEKRLVLLDNIEGPAQCRCSSAQRRGAGLAEFAAAATGLSAASAIGGQGSRRSL